MRIIAGEWRGRKLVAPAGTATRPTADRVRETLFSMLASRLGSFEDLRVADLFAGSGAFGLEALSRGARFIFDETGELRAASAIRVNLESLGAGDRAQLLQTSALALPNQAPFDLIFADPPYSPGSGTAALRSIEAAGWAAPAGWIAVESRRGELVEADKFEMIVERDIGAARISLLRNAPLSSS